MKRIGLCNLSLQLLLESMNLINLQVLLTVIVLLSSGKLVGCSYLSDRSSNKTVAIAVPTRSFRERMSMTKTEYGPKNTSTPPATSTTVYTPSATFTNTSTPPTTPTPFNEYCGDYPCNEDIGGWLERIELPSDFVVSHRAQLPNNERPTSLTYSPDGRLFASSMEGNIYVFDTNREPTVYAQGFHLPIGLVFRPGSNVLYVSSRSFPPAQRSNSGKVTIVQTDQTQTDIVTGLPCCYTTDMHQPNSLAFGPDGKVYLSIGAMSDHLEPSTAFEAAVLRFDSDGGNLERFAGGLRNPYDLTFDAEGRLFVTDNGPDYGGPELLYYVEQGDQLRFPYYSDCDYCPSAPPEVKITDPIATFVPHGAITGITTYTHNIFPDEYYNSLFVVLWSAFPGAQKIVHVQTFPTQTSDFMLGLAAPIDVAQTPSGGLVVADWATGHIFEISFGK